MKPEYIELWKRIKDYSPDSPEAALPFSARLAQENGWQAGFAQRAIEEYKRFAFLAVAAGHPVSPSDAVDQVWHLHLTYTQDYWKKFCAGVLVKPFHHYPTQGGAAEKEKFHDWYTRTLESYREHFGTEPPQDIWPMPERKRAEKVRFVRVDKAANWVIPRLRISRSFRNLFLIAVSAGLAAGCRAAVGNGTGLLDWCGPDFLRFYFILFVCCFGVAILLRWRLRQPGPAEARVGPENLDPYEVAYLNEGKVLAVNAAITSLIDQKVMKDDPASGAVIVKGVLPDEAHLLEKVVFAAAAQPGGQKIAVLRLAAQEAVNKIADGLKRKGLVVADGQATKALWLPVLIAAIAPILGAIKICIGLSRGKPVGFLVAACLLSLVGVLAGFARRPLRSRHGDAVLRELRGRNLNLRRLPRLIGTLAPEEFAMALGLFGMAALADTRLADLRKTLNPPSDRSGGCSGGGDAGGCGGGCGGGGCGGGCGGCGGG